MNKEELVGKQEKSFIELLNRMPPLMLARSDIRVMKMIHQDGFVNGCEATANYITKKLDGNK
jgi:hypothetical protein